MGRLIDTDELKERFGECPYNWTDSPEEIQEVCDWHNAMDIIDATPTVDAIPMEWLKKVRKDDRLTIDDIETIDLILTWWEEEQEAQDG